MGLKRTPENARDVAQSPRRDGAALRLQLEHADPAARRWAARDLLDCPGSADALTARLARESDPSVREVIFTTLTRMADDSIGPAMVQLLRSEDSALRNEAIEAMKHMPRQLGGMMLSLLCDPDSDVRIYAVNILESLRLPQVELWLCAVIEQDDNVNVCGTALDLLSELGTEESLESLHLVKQRYPDQPYILFAADLALARILQGRDA